MDGQNGAERWGLKNERRTCGAEGQASAPADEPAFLAAFSVDASDPDDFDGALPLTTNSMATISAPSPTRRLVLMIRV